ncbi:hypothetical protein BLOT_014091 [Blomia tropicalis]|nr:hypothetical protein BLOT_014091 [Blomia tropicalis]
MECLVSHYTIFSGGLWCMLADGCPRPQEMIRQYAEQSSAQLSNLRESVSMNHHHHPHPHPHHLLATPSHGQLTCRFSANATAANATSGNGHRSRSIDRYQPKDSTKQCKQCLQAMLTVHAAAANRRRRVSTPTNLKLKEWFNTINHKWARIKRQVILHHQRQQPLINEDNYGTTSEISCCHVSSINGSQTKSNGERQRTFGDILLNYSNDQHNCCNWNGQLDRMVTGGVEANRYTNSYDTYGYCHRRQQFGRWHEEPAFGSRYAFDTENQDPNSSESLQKQSPLLSTQTLHRKLNHVQPTSASSTPNGRCSNKRTINGMLTNGHRDPVNGSNDHLIDVCPALIKSSSIDTITTSNIFLFVWKLYDIILAILTDPIEEIRRLHLHQTHANVTMESANTIQTRNGNIITLDSIDTPPCMATIRTCHNGGKFHLQRTNSFDALNSNVPIDDAHHCNCNCGDWLLGLNLNDPNDPFGSLANGDDDIDLMINNSNINNNNENPNMVDGKTFEQLSDLFNTKQHQLLNGHLQCLSTERSTGFVLTDMNPIKPEMDNLNNGLSKTTTNGFNALNHLNGIRTNLLMNSLKPKSTTSTSSSVGGSSGDSGSGSSSSAEMNTSSSGKSVTSSRCGMGTAFSSFGLRSFSQATTIDIQSELKSHQSNNTSTTTTTTTTAKMQSNTNETTNNCDHSTSQMENMNAPIIDLLKEFDVCFNGTEHIDDDSSTLTDISSVKECVVASTYACIELNEY